MKPIECDKYYHELSTIIIADLSVSDHFEALKQAKLRAAFRGMSREVCDSIQELVVNELLFKITMYQFSPTQLAAIQKKIAQTSFRKFAKEFKIPMTHVQNMHQGVGPDYRLSTLEKIAATWNIPVWFFLLVHDLDNGKVDTSAGKKISDIFRLYMSRLSD